MPFVTVPFYHGCSTAFAPSYSEQIELTPGAGKPPCPLVHTKKREAFSK